MRGAAGRQLSQHDLGLVIAFLSGALATGRISLFTEYVRSAAGELEDRNLSARLLDDALKSLAMFFADVLDPAEANIVLHMLEQGRGAIAEGVGALGGTALGVTAAPGVDELVQSLVAGEVGAAWAICEDGWRDAPDYTGVATRLLQPALYDIGVLWQRNEITVDQEHLATSIAQTFLARFYRRAQVGALANRRSVLFASGAGNQHVVGLRMVADTFAIAGWTVNHLPPDGDTDSFIAAIDRFRPEVLGLTVSLNQHLPSLRRMVGAMRSALGAHCPVVLVGGLPINRFQDAWAWVGADAWASDPLGALKEVT